MAPSGVCAHLGLRQLTDYPRAAPALLDVLETAAVERGATTSRAYADRAEAPYVAQLESRGYRPIRASFEMQITLGEAREQAATPGGLEIRPREKGKERRMNQAAMDAFADHWGFDPRPTRIGRDGT